MYIDNCIDPQDITWIIQDDLANVCQVGSHNMQNDIPIKLWRGGGSMNRIIAVTNQKGGVGKTTTSINLGIGLSRAGKKVCLVDSDPQGNATQGLGYDPDELGCTIADILERIIDRDPGITHDLGVLHHEEGIDLVPSSIGLSVMEMRLSSVYIGREKILSTYLEMLRPHYDMIIIDCKPSLDIMTLNALTAADGAIIPVQAQYYSAKGLEQLLGTITEVISGGLNSRLVVDGILFTLANDRTNNFRQISEIVKRTYGQSIHIFSSYIPRAVTAEEAPATGQSIYRYDPSGTVSRAYAELTREFLLWEEGGRT